MSWRWFLCEDCIEIFSAFCSSNSRRGNRSSKIVGTFGMWIWRGKRCRKWIYIKRREVKDTILFILCLSAAAVHVFGKWFWIEARKFLPFHSLMLTLLLIVWSASTNYKSRPPAESGTSIPKSSLLIWTGLPGTENVITININATELIIITAGNKSAGKKEWNMILLNYYHQPVKQLLLPHLVWHHQTSNQTSPACGCILRFSCLKNRSLSSFSTCRNDNKYLSAIYSAPLLSISSDPLHSLLLFLSKPPPIESLESQV